MNKAAVYVFNDAQCMEFGYTLMTRYFETKAAADAYAKESGFKFFKVLGFDDSGNNDSDEESKRRGGQW